MTEKILFVDDEQSLLNGIKRRLGFDFDITTAESGAAALQTMEEEGPFAVVVTDMRMPHMDGVEFVKQARALASDTIYMMLTGNQDQATATQAVNDGQVFRFMNKPCQNDELRQALNAGLRQYQLVTGEKEMLHKTFYGAVGLLTDVLEISHPEIFSSANRIGETVAQLRELLGIDDRWEYKLAGKLSLLGFALMPESERAHFEWGAQFDSAAADALQTASATARRLIERIPRLETVARIIGKQAEVDGSLIALRPDSETTIVHFGATLLRVALHWDVAARQGLSVSEAVSEIARVLPNLAPQLQKALEELVFDTEPQQSEELSIGELEEGMVLFDDVLTSDGVILIRKGRRLNWSVIEKLKHHASLIKQVKSISVVARPDRVETATLSV